MENTTSNAQFKGKDFHIQNDRIKFQKNIGLYIHVLQLNLHFYCVLAVIHSDIVYFLSFHLRRYG